MRNRKPELSQLQRAILEVLATAGRPEPKEDGSVTIGHLPRVGDVVDALGRRRDKAGFASVSRALLRLERAGLVTSHRGMACTAGKGFHYALAGADAIYTDGARTGPGQPMIRLSRGPKRRIARRPADIDL